MLKRTALFDTHVRLGARLVEFGGWEMPIQYSGILQEHKAVRTAAGLFDISHMGEVFVKGPAAEAFLNEILTNDVRKLVPGQGQYTLLCREDGGVIDDLFAYRLGDGEYLLIVNASRLDADRAWMTARHAAFPRREQVELIDATFELSAVAIQGPAVNAFIDGLTEGPSKGPGPVLDRPSHLKRNRIATFDVGGTPVWLARTGYTGEDGFEIVAPNGIIATIWDKLMTAGATHGLCACGLGARDTLRTEMCFPLYGQDLTESVTPIDAGLDVFVALDKGPFCGRDRMAGQKRDGLERRLVAMRANDQATPPLRPHYPVWSAAEGGARLGETTSGTVSPSLGCGIAMAYLPVAVAEPGSMVWIEIRGRRYPATVQKKPLYRRPTPAMVL